MRMTEAETRALLIDKRLLASGWDVSDYTKVVEEYSLTGTSSAKDASSPYTNTQFSDYVHLVFIYTSGEGSTKIII